MKNNIYENLISLDYTDPIIIAEMSGNHQNSLKGALSFIEKINLNPPDIIKFQVYKPETITLNSSNIDFRVDSESRWSKHKSLFDLYTKAHTPWEWVETMVETCKSINLPWFASPFDSTAVDFLERLDCRAYKLASPEITDIGLIEKISKTGKPIVLSTGVASLEDLDLAIKTIKKHHDLFAILKCTSAYPSSHEDLSLNAIKTLEKRYKCKVGFSDHTLDDTAAIVAVALGAKIIEKHFKIDGDDYSIDSHFSKELSKLTNFKNTLKNASLCLGSEALEIPKSGKSGTSGRRSLYVSKLIKNGEKFSQENIKSVRPGFGMHPKYFEKIIGKQSTCNLQIGDRLTKDIIKDFNF